MEKKLQGQALADAIEDLSMRLNDEHYGLTPQHIHYTGGSSHNDDSLRCKVDEGGVVTVSDGSGWMEQIDPMTISEVAQYVEDCMDIVWDD